MNVIEARPRRLPMSTACAVLGLNRSSVYAWRRRRAQGASPQHDGRSRKKAVQPRALSQEEQIKVIETLHSAAFRDQPPAEVYHCLLEQNEYLCSVSTMHRLLRRHQENGERRRQRPAQHHAIPRLVAYGPNDVWTWDITKLPLMQRGVYLSLYVGLDLCI